MQTLLDIFRQFNKQDKTALIYRTGIRRFTYSYKELDRMSRQMASWLKAQGISKGDKIIIWAPNSPLWAVSFWGIILKGAVVVPVDFVATKDRVEKIAELTNASLVIQSQYKFDKFFSKNTKTVNIEDLEYILESASEDVEIEKLEPGDLAEIIYTSGTTGDPKGVMLNHKNLTTNVKQLSKHIQINSDY